LLASTLAASVLMLLAPLAARAAGPVVYVALGDSYTSAPYTGPSTNGFCAQSGNNYPHLVAAAIQAASFTDVSCAGALTDDMTAPQANDSGQGMNPPQFNALAPTTTLVTVGIGANDVGLINDIVECFSLDLLRPTGSACVDHYTAGGVNVISEMINETAPKLAAVYQGIQARSPHARILAVGYPAVLPVDGTSCWPLTPLSAPDASFLAAMIVAINSTIASVAAAHDVQYVDTYAPTIGYDVCQPWGNAGFTSVLPTSGISAPLHPNALGEQVMANAVINAVDNPPPPTPPTPRKPAKPHLELTSATVGSGALLVRGIIDRSYRGRVAVAFRSRSRNRNRAIRLHGTALVTRGRWRVTLHIPHRDRGKLHTGTLTATSHRETGLTAGSVRARLRRGHASFSL
jgi:lysophospholipase L1-like esterase